MLTLKLGYFTGYVLLMKVSNNYKILDKDTEQLLVLRLSLPMCFAMILLVLDLIIYKKNYTL